MVQTRAQQEKAAERVDDTTTEGQGDGAKAAAGTKRSKPSDNGALEESAGGEAADEGELAKEQPPAKSAKQYGDSNEKHPVLSKLLSSFASFPLHDCGLSKPTDPTAETILAHVLHALLTSTRISHQIANTTLKKVIEAGYAQLETLEKSTWGQRTQVLTDGGYTHYREKTSTELGELAKLVREKYDGDLNNLLRKAKEQGDGGGVRKAVRDGIGEVKGIGSVALDIFCDTVQGLWTELAPFVDPRSEETAREIGIPVEVEELYKAVGEDAVTMCKITAALTTVRLEGLLNEFSA
ncbi:uncharacterized protein LTR77_007023 [Saxophila tyrrhenica]|uniref:Uncharacterized protein n=1 Tax=Saxophila tyrrhenica TaxID=1690608 RepID=A0AAV9P703_9PEZI|nr:hypothetical protein LTR77_007023 [Saxophila tyrrhenica]